MKDKSRLTRHQVEQIVALRDAGFTNDQVAEKLKLSSACVGSNYRKFKAGKHRYNKEEVHYIEHINRFHFFDMGQVP